jgi:hypothetical protein
MDTMDPSACMPTASHAWRTRCLHRSAACSEGFRASSRRGGFVTGALCQGVLPGSDVDIFVITDVEARANEIVTHYLTQTPEIQRVMRTGNAITTYLAGDRRPVQIVLSLYSQPTDVIYGFDLEPCKAYAGFEDGSAPLTVYATPGWAASVSTLSFPVRASKWTMSTTFRVIKYASKGFQPYIPGLDRTRVEGHDDQSYRHAEKTFADALRDAPGMAELVLAERLLALECGDAPLGAEDIRGVRWRFRHARLSDYGVVGRMCFAWSTFFTAVMRTVGLGRRRPAPLTTLTADNISDVLVWKQPATPGQLNAAFPCAANVADVIQLPNK